MYQAYHAKLVSDLSSLGEEDVRGVGSFGDFWEFIGKINLFKLDLLLEDGVNITPSRLTLFL